MYKELFEALPDIEQQAVVQEVAAQHALALIEYENTLKAGPSTLAQDCQRYTCSVNWHVLIYAHRYSFAISGPLNTFPNSLSPSLISLLHILAGSGRALVEVQSLQRVGA